MLLAISALSVTELNCGAQNSAVEPNAVENFIFYAGMRMFSLSFPMYFHIFFCIFPCFYAICVGICVKNCQMAMAFSLLHVHLEEH